MIVAIEGIIGAGKTTLATQLHKEIKRLGASVHFIPEPTPKDSPQLKKYYEDQKRYAFQTQMSMFVHRLKCYKMARGLSDTVVLMDRSLIGDASFAYAQYKAGFMDKDEYDLYSEIYRTAASSLKLDLCLVVHSGIDGALESIAERARSDGEVNGVTYEYQTLLQEGLHHALEGSCFPVLNTHRLPFGELYDLQVANLAQAILGLSDRVEAVPAR